MQWYEYKVTQPFKWTPENKAGHSGIDLGCPLWTPVTAPIAGVIVKPGCRNWGGQVNIKAQLGGVDMVFSFLHFARIAPGITDGQLVQAGQLLGWTGGTQSGLPCNTARQYSSGAHLHFELTHGDKAPYSGSGYNPQSADSTHYPVNGASFLAGLKQYGISGAPQGITEADYNAGSDASGAPPESSGNKAHAILVEVPGMYGLCAALDAAMTFSPYSPPNDQNVITAGASTAKYTIQFLLANLLAAFSRVLIAGLGLLLLIAVFAAAINANKWIGEAQSEVVPLLIGAL